MKKTLIYAMMLMPGVMYSQASSPRPDTDKEKTDTINKTERLGEVTVTAKNIVRTPDKTILYVDNKVKRHAYDGYSALSLMTIPGVDVDVIDGSVSTHNKSIMLCINGIEATRDDIKALNPKDIRRIDYYTNFDPSHPTADYVMDFIMRIRDHGGAVMLQADHNLNRLTGSGTADWKMFQKKSEFGIRIASGYDHFDPDRGTTDVRAMQFGDEQVIRTQSAIPSSLHSGNINGKLSWLHRFDHGVLKAAASLRSTHSISHDRSLLDYTTLSNGNTETDKALESNTNSHSDRLVPSFTASYDHKFANKAKFRATLDASYSDIQGSRDYHGVDDILSTTHEKFYHIQPKIEYTLPVSKKVSLYTTGIYDYNLSRMNYIEDGTDTPTRFHYTQGILNLGSNLKITPRLRSTIRLQQRVMVNDNGRQTTTEWFFTPGATLSYLLTDDITIDGQYAMGALNPQLSHYSTDRKRIDEYLVRTGNPDLRTSRIHGGNVAITGENFQLYSDYTNVPRSQYESYTFDPAEQVYVQSYLNGGNYESFAINLWGSLPLFDKRLRLEGALKYAHSKARTYTLLTKSYIRPLVIIKYIEGGFNAEASFRTATTEVEISGAYVRTPAQLKISLGYSIDGWSFSLMSRNPFMRTYDRQTVTVPGISLATRKYRPCKDYDYFALRVSYRFNYGKKHKFEDVKIDDKGGSAILSH